MATSKEKRRYRIRKGIRSKLNGTSEMPRLAIFRSNKEVYAQVIDDVNGVTLASYNTLKSDSKGTKLELCKEAGKKIAEVALGKGVSSVVFDRGGYLYHGRVKAFAEGAREGGLKF